LNAQNIEGKPKFIKFISTEKLNERIEDLDQIGVRIIRPDLTNNPEWFLKHDLVTHPRFATSGKPLISNIIS
jgi:hypothetical protein